jgi:putative peptide zinc metalloprotease protein
MKRKNVLTSLTIATACIAGICFIPLPFHVDCAVVIEPQDARQVFAMVPGRLVKWNKKPGDRVEAGETIAELENSDLQYQLVSYYGDYEVSAQKLKAYRDMSYNDDQTAAQLKMQEEVVTTNLSRVQEFQKKVDMLKIKSKTSGVIFPAPAKPQPKGAAAEQLPSWHGNPFSEKNQDAFFSDSDLLCYVGDPDRMEAVLVVDQHDIDLVEEGVSADIKIESARLDTFSGKIEKISEMEMRVTPENLALQAGGRLNTEMDASGQLRPISTSYQARVPLENVDVPLRGGYRGQAKIYVGWKSVGWRIYRFFTRTFKFEL